MKPLWIELVNKGVANRFSFEDHELVEVNWRLTDYPDLYSRILEHEFSHHPGKYNSKDFIHDMKSKTPGLHKFMLKHISAWTQILPFYWDFKRRKLVYDISTISSWIMMLGTTIGAFYLLRWLL